jgi:hypothetical protein
MFKNILIIVLLLLSCISNIQTVDQRALDVTKKVWISYGMPKIPTNCFDSVSIIRYTNYNKFEANCQNPFANKNSFGKLTGCSVRVFPIIPWKTIKYEIHIAPENPHEFTTIQHETLHILINCTNLHPNADSLHKDLKIWKAGGEDSLETIANKEK